MVNAMVIFLKSGSGCVNFLQLAAVTKNSKVSAVAKPAASLTVDKKSQSSSEDSDSDSSSSDGNCVLIPFCFPFDHIVFASSLP